MLEKICKAELSDLQDIAALESEIFSDAWSLKSLEETWNQKNAVIFAAKTEEKIAGYLIIYYVLDEGEIARIATAPSMRRQGAAGGTADNKNHVGSKRRQRSRQKIL